MLFVNFQIIHKVPPVGDDILERVAQLPQFSLTMELFGDSIEVNFIFFTSL